MSRETVRRERGSPARTKPTPWYESFFGPDYPRRYVHTRTPEEVDAIERILRLRKGARILDLACGAGRHTVELARRGYRTTGLDRSEALLTEAHKAAHSANVRPTFLQGDMRHLRHTRTFDAVVSMFTSFGYFEDPEDDRKVLAGVARALKPRGKFLMELFNRDQLASTLPRQNWVIRDGKTVVLEDASFDSLHGRFETRQIVIDSAGTREYAATVRAYTLAELKALLEREALFVHRVLGGLDLSPYTPQSERMVLHAVKGVEPETIRTAW